MTVTTATMPSGSGSCCPRSTGRPIPTALMPRGRCGSCWTGSARRWPSSGAASTGCGQTSRSRPAMTGSSPTSATSSARTWSPVPTRVPSASTSPRRSTTGAARARSRSWRSWRWTSRAGPRTLSRASGAWPAPGTASTRPSARPAFPSASAADVARLLRVEGLTGLLTGGQAGGLADLRSRHGAALANTAFDESFHTADFRAGRGALGHFGIPELLVFVWRLTSFPVLAGTPVAVAGCADQYVFDPTGRQIPLFLPPAPDGRRLRRVLDPGPRVAGPRAADELSGDRDQRHRRGAAAPGAAALSGRRRPRPLRSRRGLAAGGDLARDRHVRGDRRHQLLRLASRSRSTTSTGSRRRSAPDHTIATGSGLPRPSSARRRS